MIKMNHESIKMTIGDINTRISLLSTPRDYCNIYYFLGKVRLSQNDLQIITDHILINLNPEHWEITPVDSTVSTIIITLPIPALETALEKNAGYFKKTGNLIVSSKPSPFEKIQEIINSVTQPYGIPLDNLRTQKFQLLIELKNSLTDREEINSNTIDPNPEDILSLLSDAPERLMEYVYNKYIQCPTEESSYTSLQIAEKLNISHRIFVNAFKKHFGRSFYQVYLDRKMEYACELLTKGYKAFEVSQMIGYTAPIKFNKRFQKQFGVTPFQYKRKHYSK
ncbi:MAG: helix-turn-helix transcriptional regulator [Spirosomataceae bacterium]